MNALSAAVVVSGESGSEAGGVAQDEMFARWVSAVQWGSGTKENAAAVVWREDKRVVGSGESSGVVTGEYEGRFRVGEKKDLLRVMNSLAVV